MAEKNNPEQQENMIKIAGFLKQKQAEIYNAWMQQQMSSSSLRLDLISRDEVEEQSLHFISTYFTALQSGNVDDINASEYEPVGQFLSQLSHSRAIQGFTPSETTSFVFSLRDVCLEYLQQEYAGDTDLLNTGVSGLSRSIDQLGLQAFEAFTRAREELAREQADTILSMATPVTMIWDNVLLLPIVGTIDSARVQAIMEVMLDKIQQTESKVILLDILGVATVDSAVSQHLIKITKATQLMGCRCVITGISSHIAQALVNLGLDLGDVVTSNTLKNGMVYAFDHLDLKVVENNS